MGAWWTRGFARRAARPPLTPPPRAPALPSYPMITEPNALNSLVAPPTVLGSVSKVFTGKSAVSDTIGEGAMSIIPWRRSGVLHTNNEIFFDIVEDIDCIVESNGSVAAFDVRGVISCMSKMSGMPDLTLIFANPSIIEDWCVCEGRGARAGSLCRRARSRWRGGRARRGPARAHHLLASTPPPTRP